MTLFFCFCFFFPVKQTSEEEALTRRGLMVVLVDDPDAGLHAVRQQGGHLVGWVHTRGAVTRVAHLSGADGG